MKDYKTSVKRNTNTAISRKIERSNRSGNYKKLQVKVILAVVKQLSKQLQIEPRKNSEASTGFEPMASAIPTEL